MSLKKKTCVETGEVDDASQLCGGRNTYIAVHVGREGEGEAMRMHGHAQLALGIPMHGHSTRRYGSLACGGGFTVLLL